MPRGRVKQPIMSRFWSYIKRSGNPNGCWEWQGEITKDGYGRFFYDSKRTRAHRYMWQLFNGNIPEKHAICHSCDNPKCVNPKHLWLGTLSENRIDCLKKGRQNTANQFTKDLAKMDKAREYRELGVPQSIIAEILGVSQATISNWKLNKTWQD